MLLILVSGELTQIFNLGIRQRQVSYLLTTSARYHAQVNNQIANHGANRRFLPFKKLLMKWYYYK